MEVDVAETSTITAVVAPAAARDPARALRFTKSARDPPHHLDQSKTFSALEMDLDDMDLVYESESYPDYSEYREYMQHIGGRLTPNFFF